MIAVSVGTSVGINALLSKSIGAGQTELTGRAALRLLNARGMCGGEEPEK